MSTIMATFNPHGNRTVNGVVITPGLLVIDYDRKVGRVVEDTSTDTIHHDRGWCGDDHWFRVVRHDGTVNRFDGSRLMAANPMCECEDPDCRCECVPGNYPCEHGTAGEGC